MAARPEQGQSPYRLLGKGNRSFDRAAEKFAHDTDRWEDFKKNYHQELRNNVSGWNDFLQNISHCAKLTLLYGAHDTEHNNAAVLREYLKKKSEKLNFRQKSLLFVFICVSFYSFFNTTNGFYYERK